MVVQHNNSAAQAAAFKKGIIGEAQKHTTTEGHKKSLTAAQLAAIQAGNFNASTKKKKKAIQKVLLANQELITENAIAAIDSGEELELLKRPLGTTIDDETKTSLVAQWGYAEGIGQWVSRFVATKAESEGYRSAERHLITLTEADIKEEFLYLTDENEYLIFYRGLSKDDPTGDEATFNADKERFLDMLPEHLRSTYQMFEDGFKEWEIANELDVAQGTISKRLSQVKQMWRKYYRA